RRSITGAAVQSLEGAAVEISLDLAPATGPERSVTETGVVELGATGRPEPSARAGALAAEDPLERRAVQPPHEPHAAELRGVGVRAVAAVHGATGGERHGQHGAEHGAGHGLLHDRSSSCLRANLRALRSCRSTTAQRGLSPLLGMPVGRTANVGPPLSGGSRRRARGGPARPPGAHPGPRRTPRERAHPRTSFATSTAARPSVPA